MSFSSDFTSPLPFSSSSKKSSFRPIKFNQTSKTRRPSQEPPFTPETVAPQYSATTFPENVTPQSPLSVLSSTDKINERIEEVTIASSVAVPEQCSKATVSEHVAVASAVEDLPCSEKAQELNNNEQHLAGSKRPVDLVDEIPTGTNQETFAVVPEIDQSNHENDVNSGKNEEKLFDLDQENVDVQKSQKSKPENKPNVLEQDHTPNPAGDPNPQNLSADSNSAEPSFSITPPSFSHAELNSAINISNSKMASITLVDESCDSVTSDGEVERPYTDDDIDDTSSLENYLDKETFTPEMKENTTSDSIPVAVPQTNTSNPPALQSNINAMVSSSNLLENEGNNFKIIGMFAILCNFLAL